MEEENTTTVTFLAITGVLQIVTFCMCYFRKERCLEATLSDSGGFWVVLFQVSGTAYMIYTGDKILKGEIGYSIRNYVSFGVFLCASLIYLYRFIRSVEPSRLAIETSNEDDTQ